MWMFGIMNKREMAELKKAGYEVKKYDEKAFNKFLEPKQKFTEFKSYKPLFLAGVWVDGGVYEDLKQVIDEEKRLAAREVLNSS